MYFETTMHASKPVADAAEAAKRIHDGEVHDYDALIWTAANGRRIAVVADNHCNSPWKEVAVIDLDRLIQIESITMGWIPELDKKTEQLAFCELTDFQMGPIAGLPLDGQNEDTPAMFECGCCGQGFKSTVATQKKYDQDNGYGICPRCARW